MEILYVVGSCLQRNTSANMSHNSYIQGLIENGHSVDIIMSNDSFGAVDNYFPKFAGAKYYEFDSIPKVNYLRDFVKKILRRNNNNVIQSSSINKIERNSGDKKNDKLFSLIKKIYNSIFINDNLYNLERKWLKTAMKFKSKKDYDLIISNSSPAASHKLVMQLKNKIKYKKWIQIWEDPWFFDIYGEKIKESMTKNVIFSQEQIRFFTLVL